MHDRRTIMRGISATLAMLAAGRALAEPQVTAIDELAPGQFAWHPDRAPGGPVAIVVSIPDQRVYVYRNGVRIGVSTCSTGKPGHETPTGVFTILEKDKHHRSSTYNNAPMPNMNRLTWSGIALHAGNLPGYPASHGCVRMPLEFSEKLFSVTRLGTPVIIADAATYPTTVLHPGLLLSDDVRMTIAAATAAKPVADKMAMARRATGKPSAAKAAANLAPPPPRAVSILISSADQRIVILENGHIVATGAATIAEPERPLGNHVYVLSPLSDGDDSLIWRTIGYYDSATRDAEYTPSETLARVRGNPDIIAAIQSRLAPGTVMMTIDLPLSADTRTGKDFVIMTDQAVG